MGHAGKGEAEYVAAGVEFDVSAESAESAESGEAGTLFNRAPERRVPDLRERELRQREARAPGDELHRGHARARQVVEMQRGSPQMDR